jgi:peptide/nickel transport system ATP-binding protein
MYAGQIVERASTRELFAKPQHPYTWGLLRSIPRLDAPRGEELIPVSGRPPSLINRPSGCFFHPRCPYVQESHKHTTPTLEAIPGNAAHRVACLLDPGVRARIWSGLEGGEMPDELRRIAGNGTAPVAPTVSAESPPVAPEVAE